MAIVLACYKSWVVFFDVPHTCIEMLKIIELVPHEFLAHCFADTQWIILFIGSVNVSGH